MKDQFFLHQRVALRDPRQPERKWAKGEIIQIIKSDSFRVHFDNSVTRPQLEDRICSPDELKVVKG